MKEQQGHARKCMQKAAQYQASDINGKLIIHFRDISHTMRALYEGKGSQKRVLMILSETGTITQSVLTEKLGIQPASVSEVMTRLEHAGLITRTVNQDDRRTTVISLTEEGMRLAEEAKLQRIQRHRMMFSCLSETEKEQLLGLLQKITDDWETRYCRTGAEGGRRDPGSCQRPDPAVRNPCRNGRHSAEE